MRVLYSLCLVAVACMALPDWAEAQSAPDKTFQAAKAAVVKIRVEGSNPDNQPKPTEEGSGFIVHSENGLTLIVTAAHVIGSSQTLQQLNTDWLVNDLEKTVKRTIKVDALDANDVLAERSPGATVLWQNDQQDVAVLSIQGSGFKTLEVVEGLPELQGHLMNVLALGYKKGERQIGFHSGMGALQMSKRYGFSLGVDSKIDEGRSGGPILDAETGKVVAIISQDVGNTGRHEAVPVAFALPGLEVVLRHPGEAKENNPKPEQTTTTNTQTIEGSGNAGFQGVTGSKIEINK